MKKSNSIKKVVNFVGNWGCCTVFLITLIPLSVVSTGVKVKRITDMLRGKPVRYRDLMKNLNRSRSSTTYGVKDMFSTLVVSINKEDSLYDSTGNLNTAWLQAIIKGVDVIGRTQKGGLKYFVPNYLKLDLSEKSSDTLDVVNGTSYTIAKKDLLSVDWDTIQEDQLLDFLKNKAEKDISLYAPSEWCLD